MSTEEHKALVHRAVDAFNQGDLRAVDQLFAPDYVDHDPGRTGLPPGPEGVKLAWQAFRAAFPDLHARIDDLVAEGDTVAVRGSIQGTHQGELMGIPPTGRVVRVTLIDFNRIRGGQLVERWAQADTVGLLQQLGVMPGPLGGEAGDAHAGAPATVASDGGDPVADGGDPVANKALTRRFTEAVLNTGNLVAIDAVVAPDFTLHLPGQPPRRGRDAFTQVAMAYFAAFPDLHETTEDEVAEGDRVARRVSWRGTHQGELMGLPATGKAVTVGGMRIFRITGGKLAEEWAVDDALGMLQQLGAMPTPEQAGA